jgi:hypothetical protein
MTQPAELQAKTNYGSWSALMYSALLEPSTVDAEISRTRGLWGAIPANTSGPLQDISQGGPDKVADHVPTCSFFSIEQTPSYSPHKLRFLETRDR